MARASRTSACDRNDARARLRTAEAYLETAERAGDERDAFLGVAVGNAVLAAIAASDAICCSRLRRMHRGDDHRNAAALLEQATPDGKQLAAIFRRLLDLKGAAHYGADRIPLRRVKDAVRWTRQLVDRAREEVER